ncbi:putative MFS family arabinose efflux permease [Panacagrimonas perspica]|uniref:Putative MFS family arabinose efflux permease n=1 Tax=Panacagrimonas perspica TaxID=381431 RepID=A0A4V3URS5_9GAMM|nr:MFS transporter [Panacagrimonas perspica]TDU26623.1 putative MFS family arabinose efflux permease [Panacagrimonas perspica]THD03981.1 MFS transporter [Panacagrimonas perspica]
MTSHTQSSRAAWVLMLCAAGILFITTGARQTLGLFVMPLKDSTGMSIASISFALAIGQFVWGAVQPVFGAIADSHGSRPVIAGGLVLLAAGMALASLADTQWMLMLSLGVISAAGAGAAGFSILIGATSANLPPERRSFAAGFINAGSSLGQFAYAPITQALISAFGWASAMLALALSALAGLPLISKLGKGVASAATDHASSMGLRAQLRHALRDRSYLLIHASYFTCGVHIAFLVTHLPGEVALCGLPAGVSATAIALIGLFNVAGSLGAGWLGSRVRMRSILFWMYAGRAIAIAIYLVSPRTPLTFYVFAAALGVSWLATTPPTAGLVGKLFGTRYLATLFGLTLLSHQTGAFFGAWLGGVTISRFGDYGWMWIADMVLAAFAALLCLPIREARVLRPAAAAA